MISLWSKKKVKK